MVPPDLLVLPDLLAPRVLLDLPDLLDLLGLRARRALLVPLGLRVLRELRAGRGRSRRCTSLRLPQMFARSATRRSSSWLRGRGGIRISDWC